MAFLLARQAPARPKPVPDIRVRASACDRNGDRQALFRSGRNIHNSVSAILTDGGEF
jgi:hypothetical protein